MPKVNIGQSPWQANFNLEGINIYKKRIIQIIGNKFICPTVKNNFQLNIQIKIVS